MIFSILIEQQENPYMLISVNADNRFYKIQYPSMAD